MLKDITSTKLNMMSIAEREALCEELREKILETVATCGGHLSSNLGAIELTVGLFTVFDFPKDKVVWDVGHQCYAHKLLSGRFDKFHTLRQKGGISGFPKHKESEYDCYDTGHAGNSVSAAIGIAKGRDLLREDYRVIAVIGDGSFNNGLIYEALNSLSILKTKILIVLNDNDMSIAPTVGSMHELLNDTNEKNIALIEQYGIKYIGGVNGNDLNEVTNALQTANQLLDSGSVLLHVKTKKGMGYDFCEENPMQTHGVSPNGATKEREYSQIFGQKMLGMAKDDEKIVAITAAMTDALGLRAFFNAYPNRSFDVGICEENAAVLCAGMARAGLKPYYAIYSTFLQRAFDEIIHDVCAQDLPITFCIDRGGVSGADGETHQGVFDLSYLSLIPNITIAVPKDGDELVEMLEFSKTFNHPLAIRYPRAAKARFNNNSKITLGSFEYLTSKNNATVTVLASGERAITLAYEAREKSGIDFDIVNARFVKPLDEKLLSAIQSKYIVTIEDNVKIGGFGDQINRFYQNSGKIIGNFAYYDTFIPQGSITQLQEEYGLNLQNILQFIRDIVQ